MTSRNGTVGLALAVLLAACTVTRQDPPAADPSSPSPTTATPTTEPARDPTDPPQEATPSLFVRPERELTDELVAAVARLDGVTAVEAPRRDDLELVASTAADGTPVDVFDPGFVVLTTAIVAEGALLDGLAPGMVWLTALGAPLRDLQPGATVRFGDHPGLEVAGTLDSDGTDTGPAEFVVHPDDAAALGLAARERMFVRLAATADAEAVAESVRSLLGPQAFVRVRRPRDDDGRPFVLSLAQTKLRFGEFAFRDRAGTRDIEQAQPWIEANIVTTDVPLLGRVVCHRGILADLETAMTAIDDAGLGGEIHPEQFAGCWYPRRTSPSGNLSKHAWGIALDINVDLGLPGGGEVPHPGVIAAFEDAGFRWGGDFPTPDNHHFEWVGTTGRDAGP